jgi:hypothetical protein
VHAGQYQVHVVVVGVAVDRGDPAQARDLHIRFQLAYRSSRQVLQVEALGDIWRNEEARNRPAAIHQDPVPCPEDLRLRVLDRARNERNELLALARAYGPLRTKRDPSRVLDTMSEGGLPTTPQSAVHPPSERDVPVVLRPRSGNKVGAMAGAKRHHVIPQFVLRNFSQNPAAKNPTISRLDKASGRISPSSVRNEAVIGHFNRLEGLHEGATGVEEDLARIESECQPAIQKVLAGADLTIQDAELIAVFAVLQERRTPRARQSTAELMEHGYRVIAEVAASNDPGVRDLAKARLGRDPSEEEVAVERQQILSDLRTGHLVLQTTSDHEVLSTFLAADDITRSVVARTRLACLHAAGAEFVLADHPVCMFDPTVPRNRGVGWLSSPLTEVTFPISRDTCLMFRPGPPGYVHVDADKDTMMDINLRSYASAEWSVYGSGQGRLQDVRYAARRNRAKVLSYEPHKRHFIFFESRQGEVKPYGVQIVEPTEKFVRGFRPKERPVKRRPQTQPVSDQLLREWSRLAPEDEL